MSGPATSTPPEIRELLTVTVSWEKFQSFDAHSQPSYAAPVTLSCWSEASGMFTGGIDVDRGKTATTGEPGLSLFFDGDDVRVQGFSLYDRFTIGDIGSNSQQRLQPSMINSSHGPNFDNVNPWLVSVVF